MSKPARPDLSLESLDAVLADADRLGGGYDKAGQWDLGMVLDHLAKSLSAPFAADQRDLPGPLGGVARFFLHRQVVRRRYPTLVTIPAPAAIRPTPGIAVDVARAQLQTAVDRVRALPAGPVRWPPFGPLSHADFLGMQLLHAAHHLSFLRPT